MITKFKLYEQLGGYNLGDVILIMYKVPKTDKREIVPVKIISEDGIHYQFSFDAPNNPFPHQRPMPFDKSMIINKTDAIKEPYKPAWTMEQPVGTDYGPPSGGKISNDFVLPNS